MAFKTAEQPDRLLAPSLGQQSRACRVEDELAFDKRGGAAAMSVSKIGMFAREPEQAPGGRGQLAGMTVRANELRAIRPPKVSSSIGNA